LKKIKSFLGLVVSFLLACAISITTFAAEENKDGIHVSFTTDKNAYTSTETITTAFTVTNTNDFAVKNVSLESFVPEGYKVDNAAEAEKQIETLGARESVNLNLAYIAANAGTDNNTTAPVVSENVADNSSFDGAASDSSGNTADNSSSNGAASDSTNNIGTNEIESGNAQGGQSNPVPASPRTGDNSHGVLLLLLAIFSGIAMIIALRLGKKQRKALLSFILCVAMMGAFCVNVFSAYDVEKDNQERMIEVSETISINGKEVSLRAVVHFELPESSEPAPVPTPEPDQTSEPVPTPDPVPAGSNILVAYFSATNNTRGIAEKIAASLDNADFYQIIPETPYTEADLNYNGDCRANREQNDPNARPAISGSVENWEDYDVVFLGYPIWWGVPPKIIYTFMESYDFSGKTVIPFCTSASSGYNDSGIKDLVEDNVTWITGQRFSSSTGQSAVQSWVDSLDLPRPSDVFSDELVRIDGGTFTMGSNEDEPERSSDDVGRILRTFKIKKNMEVTDNGKIII